jgi:hypothetical protein
MELPNRTISMINDLKRHPEPAWAGRVWHGSVFGCLCLLGAAGVVLSFLKHHGDFKFIVRACYLAVFALSLQSLALAMGAHPPTKKLSYALVS